MLQLSQICCLLIGFIQPSAAFSQNLPAHGIDPLAHLQNSKITYGSGTSVSALKGDPEIFRIHFAAKAPQPAMSITFPEKINLEPYIGIAMDITNNSKMPVGIEAQCFSNKPNALSIKDGAKFYYRSKIVLKPGETDSLYIILSRSTASLPAYITKYFPGMFGIPGGFVRRKENLDLSYISGIRIFKQISNNDSRITVSRIRASGTYQLPAEETLKNGFFPFVDEFGQYIHKDWPGKVKTTTDILNQQLAERKDLAHHSGSPNWDKYGGWKNGPSLTATGSFRVQKYNGKWWFVDPDGKLFWSQGINAIGTSQKTTTAGREYFFKEIPQNADFYRANLHRKYGQIDDEGFRDSTALMIHRRLRSWGINTLAGWSDVLSYGHQKTPYTVTLRSGISTQMPDTLDEATLRSSLRESLKRNDIVAAASDPWCIGFFVDNELVWPAKNTDKVIEQYYSIIHDEMKHFAPNKLYLGSRLNSPSFRRSAFEACARHCDVISINHYDYNLVDFKETEGLDKPVIVGEFHFGALDRGLLHPGLRAVSNQKQRGRIYYDFIKQALESPIIVGAHWFQFVDQVCSGRADGENYQIGFVDICDKPYPEMISASRALGDSMYMLRSKKTISKVKTGK